MFSILIQYKHQKSIKTYEVFQVILYSFDLSLCFSIVQEFMFSNGVNPICESVVVSAQLSDSQQYSTTFSTILMH
jgi:hypothetical protein